MTRIFKPDSGQVLEIQDEGGSAALTVETDGDIALTQDIYLAAGKGIYFDGGTTSANYLGGSDAYEKGTFTPVFANVSSYGAGSEQLGFYEKIGALVHITIRLNATSGTTWTGVQLSVTNLPFTASDSTNENPVSTDWFCVLGWSDCEKVLVGSINADTQQMVFYHMIDTGSAGGANYSSVSTSDFYNSGGSSQVLLTGTLTYRAK